MSLLYANMIFGVCHERHSSDVIRITVIKNRNDPPMPKAPPIEQAGERAFLLNGPPGSVVKDEYGVHISISWKDHENSVIYDALQWVKNSERKHSIDQHFREGSPSSLKVTFDRKEDAALFKLFCYG